MFVRKKTWVWLAGFGWLWVFTLSTCSPLRDKADTSGNGSNFYLPPTAASTANAPVSPSLQETPSPSSLPPTSMPEPVCQNNLRFIKDLTIPDGTQVNTGQLLDKRWSVENSGTCNWNEQYRMKLIAGPELGASAEQALYPARSGTEATIRIVFTSPDKPGRYRSAWQAYTPDGVPFGDPYFIEFIVPEINPTATP
jgi:hypothetical protein